MIDAYVVEILNHTTDGVLVHAAGKHFADEVPRLIVDTTAELNRFLPETPLRYRHIPYAPPEGHREPTITVQRYFDISGWSDIP